MNRREGGMTLDDWREVLQIAATIWPHSQGFFDDPLGAERTPTRTWWAALSRFETDDVLAALGRLGMSSRFWPSLAEVVEATREVIGERRERENRAAQDAVLRLSAPRQDTVAERLAVFDQTAALARAEHQAEVRRVAITCGHSADGLTDGAAPGPWEQRVRAFVDREWPAAVTMEPEDARSTPYRGHRAALGDNGTNDSIAGARSLTVARRVSLQKLCAAPRSWQHRRPCRGTVVAAKTVLSTTEKRPGFVGACR